MTIFTSLLTFSTAVAGVIGLILLLFKSRRKTGKRLLIFAFVGAMATAFADERALDIAAKQAGFKDAEEQSLAATYFITDADEWAHKRAELISQTGEILTQEELEDRRKGFHCLSKWDGSHAAFKQEILDQLRDPDSFDHVETRVTPVGGNGRHQLYMDYRAKNGFGGMNFGTAKGYYDHETCEHVVLTLD